VTISFSNILHHGASKQASKQASSGSLPEVKNNGFVNCYGMWLFVAEELCNTEPKLCIFNVPKTSCKSIY